MSGKKFRPDYLTCYYILVIALAIFILGVQIDIKHGRELQLDELRIEYGDIFTN